MKIGDLVYRISFNDEPSINKYEIVDMDGHFVRFSNGKTAVMGSQWGEYILADSVSESDLENINFALRMIKKCNIEIDAWHDIRVDAMSRIDLTKFDRI